MKDPSKKIKSELTEENSFLKQRIKELEQSGSDRKRVEEALQESERKFKNLSDESVAGAYPIQDGPQEGGNISPGTVLDIRILKACKLEQILDMLAANVDLDAIGSKELDFIIQNGNEVGGQFTDFLKTMGKLIVNEVGKPRVIKINREELFDPVQFMCHAGLEIEEEDERSVMLEEIDLSAIALKSMLQGETAIRGEEHLKRLKQMGHIRLDARIFQTLWENQHFIPEYWKGTTKDAKHIFFDGTVLKNQHGRYIISMYWDSDEKWRWTYCRLDIGGWKAEDLSAVLRAC